MLDRKARSHPGILAIEVQEQCFPHQGQDELSLKPLHSEGRDTSATGGNLLVRHQLLELAAHTLIEGRGENRARNGKNRPF